MFGTHGAAFQAQLCRWSAVLLPATFLPRCGLHEGRGSADRVVAPTSPKRRLTHSRCSVSGSERPVLNLQIRVCRIMERNGDDVCKSIRHIVGASYSEASTPCPLVLTRHDVLPTGFVTVGLSPIQILQKSSRHTLVLLKEV